MKSLSMLPVWKGGDLTVGEQISPLIKVTAWQGGTGMLCRHFASGPFPSREAPARWYLSADKQEQLQQAALAVISVQDWWYCCLYTRSFCRPEVYKWSDVPSQPSLDISRQAEACMVDADAAFRKQALFGWALPHCHNNLAEQSLRSGLVLAGLWLKCSVWCGKHGCQLDHVCIAAKLESGHQLISHQLLGRYQCNRHKLGMGFKKGKKTQAIL